MESATSSISARRGGCPGFVCSGRLKENVDPALATKAFAGRKMSQKMFSKDQRAFFSKLVPNVGKLGLLDANNGYLRKLWGEAGLLEYEFAEDTSADYEQYDAVAQDRAAASAGESTQSGDGSTSNSP